MLPSFAGNAFDLHRRPSHADLQFSNLQFSNLQSSILLSLHEISGAGIPGGLRTAAPTPLFSLLHGATGTFDSSLLGLSSDPAISSDSAVSF
jgi:hypothetical protein